MAAAKEKAAAIRLKWSNALAADSAAPPAPRPPSSRTFISQSLDHAQSSIKCADVRIFEASSTVSTTTFSRQVFRERRSVDSDDAASPHRPYIVTSPRDSPSHLLPDLEPLHHSVDELLIDLSAGEDDLDFDVAPRG